MAHLSRRQFLQTAAATGAMAAAQSDRPNIIFLMADEHRYGALNYLGNSTVHSPNLDRMASQGVRFQLRLSPANNKAILGISDWSKDNRIVFSEWNQQERWRGPVLVNPDGSNYHRVEKLKGCAWVRGIQ
jgi:hypothetical protein